MTQRTDLVAQCSLFRNCRASLPGFDDFHAGFRKILSCRRVGQLIFLPQFGDELIVFGTKRGEPIFVFIVRRCDEILFGGLLLEPCLQCSKRTVQCVAAVVEFLCRFL